MNLIVDMVRKNNQTLIIVTHDRSIAEYADKVVTIRDGDIVSIEMQTPYETRSASISKDAEKSGSNEHDVGTIASIKPGAMVRTGHDDVKAQPVAETESESKPSTGALTNPETGISGDADSEPLQTRQETTDEHAESVEDTYNKRAMRSKKRSKSFFKKNHSKEKEKKNGQQGIKNGQSTEESIEDEQI